MFTQFKKYSYILNNSINDHATKIHTERRIRLLSLSNVALKKDGKYLLKNVSWQINKGEHWSILGLNGSGKTTLLKMINGYHWPTEGEVQVLGKKFGKTSLPALRKDIGWVSSSLQQEIHNDSVLSIILSGKFASIGLYNEVTNQDLEKAKEIMDFMDCAHLQHTNFHTLSQGEQQRVLIARALMAQPKLLLLDEPCSGLDIIQKDKLLSHIEKLANQKDGPTLIYVTHHVEEILPVFTHTLLLREGSVFDSGRTEELFTEATLSQFFNRPIKLHKDQNHYWISIKQKNEAMINHS